MKVASHINGTIQIVLEPESTIEKAIVEVLVERAAKGATVKLESSPGGMSLTMAG
jgi:hypothetical protein